MKNKLMRWLLCAAFFACTLLCSLRLGSTAQGAVAANTNVLAAMADQWVSNSTFACSGKVSVYTDVKNNKGYTGSGQLITPRWFITAGHMITTAAETGRTIQEIRFKMGPNALSPVLVVVADFWTNYPGVSGTGQEVDLALVHLSQSVNDVAPAVLYHGTQASITGQPCWTTGNGSRGIAGQPLFPADYLERAGQNILGDCIPPWWLDADYLFYDFTPPGDSNAQPFEALSAPGDSGGGVWVFTNMVWYLAGIISGGTTDPYYNFGNQTYAYFVGAQLDWIYGVIGVTPALSIQKVEPETFRVSWPSWATSFTLQSCTNLNAGDWAPVGTQLSVDGPNTCATFSTSGPQQFWRLVKQPTVKTARGRSVPVAPKGSYDDLIGWNP